MFRPTRRTRRLALGAAVALAMVALALAVLGRLFVVRDVQVVGVPEAQRDAVIRAAGVGMGRSIREVNADELRRSLESTGRYAFEDVEVRYPDTVVLTVRERTRDAVMLSGGKIVVMDAGGCVVEICDAMPEDAGIYVSGLDGVAVRLGEEVSAPAEKLAAMRSVLEAIRAQDAAAYVSELNVSDPLNMWITTRSGIRVELGDAGNMSGKILWMRSAVADLQARGETRGTLDVSSGSKADFLPGSGSAQG